jgi:hypothetical protein
MTPGAGGALNVIEFRVERVGQDAPKTWVTITPYIDGTNLRELAKEVELPFAVADGEPDLAGSYEGIEAGEEVRWPSRHYLDGPTNQWLDDGDTRLLGCPCSVSGCWDLTAQVELTELSVTWSGFRMGHRDWDLAGLGPFRFDRTEYEQALRSTARVRRD